MKATDGAYESIRLFERPHLHHPRLGYSKDLSGPCNGHHGARARRFLLAADRVGDLDFFYCGTALVGALDAAVYTRFPLDVPRFSRVLLKMKARTSRTSS